MATNRRYSSRLWPVSSSTSRAAPDTSARHGARVSTSPSTTGENGVSVIRTAPQSRNSVIRAVTSIWAATRRRGSASLSASRLGGQPGGGGDRLGDRARQLGAEERAGHRLRDGPLEQALRVVHREQRGDHAGARRLAEDGDVAGVAAEPLDVVPDPAQRRDRVEQAAVGGGPGDLGEALHAQAVVAGDEHHAGARERRAVVAGTARAEQVGAAVNPDHDRERARLRVRGPHVDGQPLARGVLRHLAGVRACRGTPPGEPAGRTPPRRAPRPTGPAAPAAWNRRSKSGGCANGMPRKTAFPCSTRPRTRPDVMETSGSAGPMGRPPATSVER